MPPSYLSRATLRKTRPPDRSPLPEQRISITLPFPPDASAARCTGGWPARRGSRSPSHRRRRRRRNAAPRCGSRRRLLGLRPPTRMIAGCALDHSAIRPAPSFWQSGGSVYARLSDRCRHGTWSGGSVGRFGAAVGLSSGELVVQSVCRPIAYGARRPLATTRRLNALGGELCRHLPATSRVGVDHRQPAPTRQRMLVSGVAEPRRRAGRWTFGLPFQPPSFTPRALAAWQGCVSSAATDTRWRARCRADAPLRCHPYRPLPAAAPQPRRSTACGPCRPRAPWQR
jgi:hypothetical protein